MKITPWASTVMKVAVFSAAFAIPGTAMASASVDPTQITSGNGSLLGGNAVNVPVSAPIDVCGNALGVLGNALGACAGGAGGSATMQRTSGNNSVLGGNAVNAPVKIPVNACGNAIGNARAVCQGGASVGGTSNNAINSGGPRRGGGGVGGGAGGVGG